VDNSESKQTLLKPVILQSPKIVTNSSTNIKVYKIVQVTFVFHGFIRKSGMINFESLLKTFENF
jgi:hypothetical protein